MLARLDREMAPIRAETDHSGTFLRLAGETGDDLVAKVLEVLNEMGYGAEPLSGEGMPDRWYGLEEVIELSMEEAAVLAANMSRRMRSEAGLSEERSAELQSVLESTMREAFIEFDRAGQPPLEMFLERVVDAAGLVLTAEETERLRALLHTTGVEIHLPGQSA